MKFRFQYIYTAFILSFIILTVLSFLFYKRLMSTNRFSNEVEHTYETLYLLNKVDSYLKDAISAERGFILSRDSTLLEPYLLNQHKINPLIDSLRTLSIDNARQQVHFNNLKRIMSERLQMISSNINKAALGEEAHLDLRLLRAKVLMNEYDLMLQRIEGEARRMLLARNEQKELYQRNTPNFLYVIFVFSAITFVVSFFIINRELRKRLGFQQQLQQQVGVLNRANAELEQLTHTASHHLQEPLRKIRTFADRLANKHKESIPEETRGLLHKIENTAAHMQGLTDDMAKYSSLITAQEYPTDVDLNYVLLKVAEKMDERLALQEGKLIITNSLPVIRGIPHQLATLFEQLIDNSLKFSRKDEPPVITITREEISGKKISDTVTSLFGGTIYHKVSVADNGMGFSNEFAEKIFELFQKLDTHQLFYQSKGIGLAMVQRIMINHGGNVNATGIIGKGATFYLYFPIPPV